jgi:hypothetical protein
VGEFMAAVQYAGDVSGKTGKTHPPMQVKAPMRNLRIISLVGFRKGGH